MSQLAGYEFQWPLGSGTVDGGALFSEGGEGKLSYGALRLPTE